MKLIIAAFVIIPIALFVQHKRSSNLKFNDAFAVYQRFATAYHHDRIAECRSISDGDSVKALVDAREKRHLELAKAGATDAATMTVVGTSWERTTQTTSGDDIVMGAVMTLKYMPAGMYSTRNIPQTQYLHSVTLRRIGGSWTAIDFTESELK